MRPVRPHIRHASGEEGLQLKGVQHRITADEKIKVRREGEKKAEPFSCSAGEAEGSGAMRKS